MTPDPMSLSEKRLAVLKQLRAQKGSLRRRVKASDNQTEINAERLEPFLRRRHADPSLGDRVSKRELKAFLEEFKKQKRAREIAESTRTPSFGRERWCRMAKPA